MSNHDHNLVAIMTGSLSIGFMVNQIMLAKDAAGVVAANLANGILTEAVKIDHPRTIWENAPHCDENGAVLVSYGTPGNGLTLYGPFADDDAAEEFAERCRKDGDDWEIFTVSGPAPQDADEADVAESPAAS